MLHALDQAIAVHNLWKARLHNAIQGSAFINESTIRDDKACDLGKWIHGDESTPFRLMSEFINLESKHARFHLIAAEVVSLVHKGETTKALKELDFGQYAKASAEVVQAIEALKEKLTKSNKG